MVCIICKLKVDFDPFSPLADDERAGGTLTLTFGYGSRHDTQVATGAVCDGCFEKLIPVLEFCGDPPEVGGRPSPCRTRPV